MCTLNVGRWNLELLEVRPNINSQPWLQSPVTGCLESRAVGPVQHELSTLAAKSSAFLFFSHTSFPQDANVIVIKFIAKCLVCMLLCPVPSISISTSIPASKKTQTKDYLGQDSSDPI